MRLSSSTVATFGIAATLTGLLAVGAGHRPAGPASSPTPTAAKRRPPTPDGRMRYDRPAEAEVFAALKRVTGIETKNGQPPLLAPPLPVQRYQQAAARIRRMPQYSSATGQVRRAGAQVMAASAPGGALGTWSPLGPGNIGGRTRQLVFHPTNPDIMYAAAVAGGVWKSTDGGASWNPLTDLVIPNIAVNSLAIDPKNPSILYAGTGEGYFNGDSVRGAGVFKTIDGGATWTQLSSTANSNFYYVNDVVVSSRNSLRLWAATRTGVWRSTNGGTTWTRVLNPSAVLGGCTDLVAQTDRAVGYIFAACGTFQTGAGSGIWRGIENGGATPWQQVLGSAQEPGLGRTALALAPSNQDILYALSASTEANNYQDGLLAVFRSTASGAPGTFTAQVRNTSPNKLNTMLLTNPVYGFLADCGYGSQNQFYNQGWYDNVIAVDPKDPNRVWAGGIDLFRSDDGGQNWGVASYWWFFSGVDGFPQDPWYAHADNHVIAFHPSYDGVANKTMYVASDGGISRTDDAQGAVGTTVDAVCGSPVAGAVTWSTVNGGYGVTQFYHGTPYPDGDTYFGGTQDNGTVRGSQGGGQAWVSIQGGDGGYTAVDPTNTNVLFAEYTGLSITKSSDGGASFFDAVTGINDPGFLFIAPFIMNDVNAQQMWTGGWYIWRTSNQATSWQRASAITPGSGSVSALAVSPVNQNNAVVGMSDGYLLRTNIAGTANSGTSWPSVRPRSGYVSWLAFDPTDANTVYATYATFNSLAGQSHVYKSTNGGATWVGIDGAGLTGIPDLPVHSIVVDPTDNLKLYLGTDAGVFTSIDGGASWYKEVTGYANVVTEALRLNTAGSVQLFAFTHGRSAWSVNLQ